MEKKKRILLLGATGSIGSQTLDVLRQHPDDFELIGVSAGHQKDVLEQILAEFPSIEKAALASLDTDIEIEGKEVFGGEEGMVRLSRELDYDLLVNAVVGFRGLEPTLCAIERDIDVALANKESLVCGGELVKAALAAHEARLYPIDSEHSAIFQCLQGSDHKAIRSLLITASGGSLRDLSRKELHDITPERALKHPSWSMGKRITIDSATMVNKGFEVIEAHYLFDVPYENITPVLHPQSIVHSMVEFNDRAILAQLGSADMRLPIQFALYASHTPVLQEANPLSFEQALTLDFSPVDNERYPMLGTAVKAGKQKGNAGCIFNAADEQAVELFLEGKISFLQIEEAIVRALQKVQWIEHPSLEDLKKTDRETRELVKKWYL